MNRSSMSSKGRRLRLAVIAPLFLAAGCTMTSNVQQIDQLETVGENPRIVMMPADIRYYRLTAGGVPEPNADWTEAARTNFKVAMTNYAKEIGAEVEFADSTNMSSEEIRYETLHAAVGLTLMNNHFGMFKLPSKGENFDWSLGPDVKIIGENQNADYALFVYYRDYQATGGRVAFAILAAAAGVGVATGSEHGFASLVDLKTGDIVWFNLVMSGGGEFRSPDGAATAVKTLFKDIPTSQGSGG